jgi:hypothetical protein
VYPPCLAIYGTDLSDWKHSGTLPVWAEDMPVEK